jgi:phosphoribosylglycinamide formyltransferase-1
MVDFAAGRFDDAASARALGAADGAGFRLMVTDAIDDRLAAWIDWQFAPSWWSAEARASSVWYALDARGEIAGFAAFGARGLPYPWLHGYGRRTDVGIFGPFGVAPEYRKSGLGDALLTAALSSLRAQGYARALIPAVGFERLAAMYAQRTGAEVADRYAYEPPRRFRATILASGSGTNAQSVFDGAAAGRLPLEFGGLITNMANAPAIDRALRAGVPVETVVWARGTESRAAYDERVIAAVAATRPDVVLLLGWMHLLPPAFIERFPEILNIHPAFLPLDPRSDHVVMPDGTRIPAFRGAHALRDALAAGVRWVGASVHRVTAETDRGAIVVRTPLRLDAAPERAAVAERLRPIEHAAVGAAIRRWSFERSAAQPASADG